MLPKNGRERSFSFAMARTYLIFGDIEGKLNVLRVECTKCPRKGRYPRNTAARPT
jgi:hypothetical protein